MKTQFSLILVAVAAMFFVIGLTTAGSHPALSPKKTMETLKR